MSDLKFHIDRKDTRLLAHKARLRAVDQSITATLELEEMLYRKDIDGLRAVAVVPVVLFHADLHIFSGGFVGVDIFFVISGFLITSLIAEEIRKDVFTVVSFYERRIRRIFPALFAVVMFSYVLAFSVFMPEQFLAFGKSVVGATLFSSNVLFWLESGYFDGPAEMKPLLHTWSLAVEEQFYIVFPIFLIIIKKYFNCRWITLTLPLALISFAVSVWGVHHQPSATFYLAPTRAWELLLGSLLALGLFPLIGNRIVREALSVLGLGLIAWSVFTYSSKTPFPGLSALAPCVGAALVMHTGASGPSAVAKLLSARAIVFTGLISYSLYLWHWPLIVFAKYYWIRDLTTAESLAVIAVSVVASVLSWRFIEKPFRKKNGVFRRSALFAGAGTVMAGSIALGFTAQLSNGWPQRLPPDVAELSMAAFDKDSRIARCNGLRKGESAASSLCLLGKPDALPNFLLWGDSQAGAMMPAIDAAAAASSQSGYYASLGGCAPLLGTRRADPIGSPVCLPFNNTVLDFLDNNRMVRKVILVGRWSENFEIERYVSNDSPLILVDEIAPEPGDNNNAVFKRGFERTIQALRERSLEVVILTQTPDLSFNAPDRLARERYFEGAVKSDRFDARLFYNRQSKALSFLEELQKKYDFALVGLHPAICNERDCFVVRGSDVLYSDFTHLTKKGAQLTLPIVSPIFSETVGNDLPILNETPGKYAAIAK